MATVEILGQVPVGVSGRHVHVSEEALARLFGPGYKLTNVRDSVATGSVRRGGDGHYRRTETFH